MVGRGRGLAQVGEQGWGVRGKNPEKRGQGKGGAGVGRVGNKRRARGLPAGGAREAGP